MHKSPTVTDKQLRSFGLIVGGIFGIIGLWPLIRQEPVRLWALITGGVLILPALVFPACLKHPYRGWMALGHALGWVNTRIILGLTFFLVVTPMSLVMRLFGKDAMHRHFESGAETYRVVRPTRPAAHMRRQF